ncbi:MAG: RibD family protein, partial [Gammaproteobacteria bacterium]
RIILSSNGNIDHDLLEQLSGETWVVSAKKRPSSEAIYNLHLPDVKNPEQVDLPELLAWLVKQGCHSVLVEGGNQTLATFFQQHLVNELHIYQALTHSGWQDKPALPFFINQQDWVVKETQHFGNDIFIRAVKHV